MSEPKQITILGAGPAGLAVGYYAQKNGIPYKIYEALSQIGGGAVTIRWGDFLFDSGAHRFHNLYPEVTEELAGLLGDDFKKINAPSQIYHHNKLIDFPLSPLNLIKNLGAAEFFKAGWEHLSAGLKKKPVNQDFESFALRIYGKTVSEYFLLNYSEKLWGRPADELSLDISGRRMKGLTFKTFILETLRGKKTKTEHLDGSFFYPKTGIGAISEKLGEFCGSDNILRNAKVTKILHDEKNICSIEINANKRIAVNMLVNTLPLNLFLGMLEPRPPEEIMLLAESLSFRDLILVALFLNRDSVTKNATVYFPEAGFPFTRIYEQKNRSAFMSPVGKTSLVAEIPCSKGDKLWNKQDHELIQMVSQCLIQIGWIREEQILGAETRRMPYAYPILELGCQEKLDKINAYLSRFNNLRLSGRNARFVYAHIHDIMKSGKEIIEREAQ